MSSVYPTSGPSIAQTRSGRPGLEFSPRYILVRVLENRKPSSDKSCGPQGLSFSTSTNTSSPPAGCGKSRIGWCDGGTGTLACADFAALTGGAQPGVAVAPDIFRRLPDR